MRNFDLYNGLFLNVTVEEQYQSVVAQTVLANAISPMRLCCPGDTRNRVVWVARKVCAQLRRIFFLLKPRK
jgi:hypothetical protein